MVELVAISIFAGSIVQALQAMVILRILFIFVGCFKCPKGLIFYRVLAFLLFVWTLTAMSLNAHFVRLLNEASSSDAGTFASVAAAILDILKTFFVIMMIIDIVNLLILPAMVFRRSNLYKEVPQANYA